MAVLTGSGSSRTYAPAANYNGPDSFTYKVTDRGDPDPCSGPAPACSAALDSYTRTVSITVNPVNDKPSASATPTSLTMDEDDSGTNVDVSGSDLETGATGLTFTITQAPAHGTLKQGVTALSTSSTFTGSPKTLTYKPDANFNGSDSFTFKVTDTGDPIGCSPVGVGCSAKLDSDAVTVPITVRPVNDKPIATDGSATLNEDASAVVDLGALVSDVETGDSALVYSIVSGPSHGGLTGAGQSKTYTPAAELQRAGQLHLQGDRSRRS